MATNAVYAIIYNKETYFRYNHYDNYPMGMLSWLKDWSNSKYLNAPKEELFNNILENTEKYSLKEKVAVNYKYIIDLDTKKIWGIKIEYDLEENREYVRYINVKDEALKNVKIYLNRLREWRERGLTKDPMTKEPINKLIDECLEFYEEILSLPDEWFSWSEDEEDITFRLTKALLI